MILKNLYILELMIRNFDRLKLAFKKSPSWATLIWRDLPSERKIHWCLLVAEISLSDKSWLQIRVACVDHTERMEALGFQKIDDNDFNAWCGFTTGSQNQPLR